MAADEPYKIVPGASKSTPGSRESVDWLAKDGQLLVPLVELLETGERAIDVMGRSTFGRESSQPSAVASDDLLDNPARRGSGWRAVRFGRPFRPCRRKPPGRRLMMRVELRLPPDDRASGR